MQKTNERLFIPHHSIGLFDRAESAAKESQGVVCVILAVAAVEAFTHDLVEWYSFCEKAYNHQDNGNNQLQGLPKSNFNFTASNFSKLTQLEMDICKKLNEAEDNKKNVCKKLELILNINGEQFCTGKNPYQDFSSVVKIRNAIIHAKGEKLVSNEEESIRGYPKFIKELANRKLIKEPSNLDFNSSWLNIIETKEFSNWCTSSVKNMVNKTLDLLPPTKSSKLFIERVQF